MKKLILFGISGNFGKAAADVLQNKNYDHYYFIGSRVDESLSTSSTTYIHSEDLSLEPDVISVFNKINFLPEDKFFLLSTIGKFAAGNSLAETNIAEWDGMYNSNLKSNFLIAKHFIHLAEKCRGGAICFTTAISGFSPAKMRIAYGSAKSAMNYLIEALADECKSKNISVMGIAPYIIDTAENRGWVDKAEYDSLQKPIEMAELVHYLFSNYHFLSGNIIRLKNRFAP